MSAKFQNLNEEHVAILVEEAIDQISQRRVSITREQAEQVVGHYQSRFTKPRYPREEPKTLESLLDSFGKFIDNSAPSWISYVSEKTERGGRSIA